MHARFIFNTSGRCVAYIHDNYVFSSSADWLGFLGPDGNSVYLHSGILLGTLTDDDRLIRDPAKTFPEFLPPPPIPTTPFLAIEQLKRPKMATLPYPLEDVLEKEVPKGVPIEVESSKDFLLNLKIDVDGENGLREPQRNGYKIAVEAFESGKNFAIIQLPVGCGKSGLASILPLGLANGRVLIIAPNLTIKDELFDAMDITNRQKCFWRKTGVLKPEQMLHGPLACTLETGNLSVVRKAHIVITNVQQLAANPQKWLAQFGPDFFDMIIVDEAHHSAAKSWENAIERFPNAKVVFLTATPFRSDGKVLKGTLIYRFSFRRATQLGYIKRLKASYVAPSEVQLRFKDREERTYTLDEVLKLKEDDLFSRGVAMSPACNKSIVDNSLAKLEELRQSGTHHQLIAVACSIDHAKSIRALYKERNFNAAVIHSELKEFEREAILLELRSGALDCIIQVQMLGEGFDHPKLSVAAIFRPFRTLAPYIQFVGRVMRVIVQNDPAHVDNVGHIVTHLGMNVDQRLREFKQFEDDDEEFWERVIGGAEPEVPAEVKSGSTRLKSSESIVVHGEVVESLWEEDFTSVEDQQVIDELREKFTLLGLDPSVVEEMVQKAKRPEIRKNTAAEPFSVQPQRAWEQAKVRLDEQSKRLARLLLNNAGLSINGLEIPYKYTSLRLSGKSNFICALMMVNKQIGDVLGKPRQEASTEEFQIVLNNLDKKILEPLVRKLLKVKAEYEKQNPKG